MSTQKTVTPRGLASELRAIEKKFPKAVEAAMREGASMLKGALIPIEIALAEPMPVDRGAYKGSWRKENVPGGARVKNSALYSGMIERGRRPGKAPPAGPIRAWVARKGLHKEEAAAARSAARRPESRRGLGRMSPKERAARNTQRKKANEASDQKVINRIAYLIQRKIARVGTTGHGILFKAMVRLQRKLPGIVERNLRERVG